MKKIRKRAHFLHVTVDVRCLLQMYNRKKMNRSTNSFPVSFSNLECKSIIKEANLYIWVQIATSIGLPWKFLNYFLLQLNIFILMCYQTHFSLIWIMLFIHKIHVPPQTSIWIVNTHLTTGALRDLEYNIEI